MSIAAGYVILMLATLGVGDGLGRSVVVEDPTEKSVETTEKIERTLEVPVLGVVVSELADTWGGPRSEGRRHEGIDIFAERNRPITPAVAGRIFRQGWSDRGGHVVWVLGDDGRRHYYAHLEGFGAQETGQRVEPGDTIGFVGNSGNAQTTPPHLHYGIYTRQGAINPYPLLTGKAAYYQPEDDPAS